MVLLLVRLPIGPDSCSQSRYLLWLNIEQQITSLWCFCWTRKAIITALSPLPFWHPPVRGTHTTTVLTQTQEHTPVRGSLRLFGDSPAHLTPMGRHDYMYKKALFRQLLHVCRHISRQTDGDCISCRTTSGAISQWLSFHPIEGRVDDSGRGWQTAGWAHWWSPHNTQTDESEGRTTALFCLQEEEGMGGGFFTGFQSDAIAASHMVRHAETKAKAALSQLH